VARFLFVVPPFTGHVNPTVPVALALERRGHRVAWTGHASAIGGLLPPGAELLPLDEGDVAAREAKARAFSDGARGLLAFKQLWEELFLPLARGMLPGVERSVEQFGPDVLLSDQQALAGALVARRRGLPWATLATTSARIKDSLEGLPKVRSWIEERLAALEVEAGLEPVPDPDLSPRLVLLFSSELLAGAGRFPPQTRFVGPALEGRPEPTPFPWERLAARPRLLVSLGTLNASRGGPLYRVLGDALADEDLQVILVAPLEAVGSVPDNFLVRERVPQLALLPRVQAVLCHGGHNTVCEALAEGLPLLVMPIRDDQPVIAQQVVDCGAGLRLRFGRTSATELREAVRRVSREAGFRAAAVRIQESFRAAGGATAAADAIEALA
jgi:MGT family glycosyltransferase